MNAARGSQGTLLVSTQPLPGDVRVGVVFQPGAPTGGIEVQVGLGRGTRGKGERIGDDPALYVAILFRLAAHLVKHAEDFADAAMEEQPNWWPRVWEHQEALAAGDRASS